AVAAGDEHRQLGARDLEAGAGRERAAVHAVKAVARRVGGDARRAADAGDDRDLVRWQLQRRERARDRAEDREVAASGAPDRLVARLVVGGGAWRRSALDFAHTNSS